MWFLCYFALFRNSEEFLQDKYMTKGYPILMNEYTVWLDMKDDGENWDIDVFLAHDDLKDLVQREPSVKDLIEAFDCDIVVDTNHEYYPFSNQNVDQENKQTLVFGALALLFQPLVKIALGRLVWNVVDVVVAVLLIGISLRTFKMKDD